MKSIRWPQCHLWKRLSVDWTAKTAWGGSDVDHWTLKKYLHTAYILIDLSIHIAILANSWSCNISVQSFLPLTMKTLGIDWCGGMTVVKQSSTTHFLLFKVKELKDRHPENLHENWPPWKFPDPGSKLLSGLHLLPDVPVSLIVLSFCILTTHSLDQLGRLSKMVGCDDLKRHAFKASFIKNFIKGFATFSFAFFPASLWAASQNSPPRGIHWKFITHHQLLSTWTLWESGNKQPRILSHLFVP